jgi:2-oxoglutarate dehydrogenase E2 component (dihydrolipoamide succinyltransferase)
LCRQPFFIDATVRALRDFPMINASIDGGNIVLKKYINLGIAVALDNGLIVPVIKSADALNLVGLARATNDLASRARNKQLKPDEVQGGTFSITNMGSFGNLFGIPVINQPQVAILGIGAIKKTPVVVGDGIAIRDIVYLSLSYDHRLIDGAYGGQFLQRVVDYLETFESPK